MKEPRLHWSRHVMPWVSIAGAVFSLLLEDPTAALIFLAIGGIAQEGNQQAKVAIAIGRKLDAMHDDIRRQPW